jgi:hypothetical protein
VNRLTDVRPSHLDQSVSLRVPSERRPRTVDDNVRKSAAVHSGVGTEHGRRRFGVGDGELGATVVEVGSGGEGLVLGGEENRGLQVDLRLLAEVDDGVGAAVCVKKKEVSGGKGGKE